MFVTVHIYLLTKFVCLVLSNPDIAGGPKFKKWVS